MDKNGLGKADQISHKVIEKRRRDRINMCLSELSQTVPVAFSKQTSGKLEKAEILEMTVEYLRAIQYSETCIRIQNGDWFSSDIWTDFMHHYQTGYNDCIREILRYMTNVEGLNVNDERCIRLMSYLHTRFRPKDETNGFTSRQLRARSNSNLTPSIHQTSNCYDTIRGKYNSMDSSLRFRPYDNSLRQAAYPIHNANTKTDSNRVPLSVATPLNGLFGFKDQQTSFFL